MRMARRMGIYSQGSFKLPVFTGSYAIFGDARKGYIELYSSGTLTLAEYEYDLHAVGGGTSGRAGTIQPTQGGSTHYLSAGGGSGYTNTTLSKSVAAGSYAVIIGSGGVGAFNTGDGTMYPANAGGATQITLPDVTLSALGGKITNNSATAVQSQGTDGGSGGGAGAGNGTKAGNGGSDGSNGENGNNNSANANWRGGIGQGATTRDFGEPTGTLRAGGGGGQGNSEANKGLGGDGGGGYGKAGTAAASSGANNTGSGEIGRAHV